nr:NACHT domain-containing protein [Streptomyces sp. NRRL S-337]
MQWLAVSCTKAPGETPLPHLYGRIPFVLPLRTLTRDGAPLPTPDRFLAAVGCPLSDARPDGWTDRILASGRGLLLVDGLDEIPDRERTQARRWLRDLLDAFPDNLWLVTTRPSAVRDDWLASDGFDELTLAPLRRAEVTAFIGRWHDAARRGAEDPARLDAYEQSLLAAVHTKQDLARLATNPLMCGLICALHRDRRGYLPTGRKELYDAALVMLLSRRDRERDMAAPTGIELNDEPQIQLLQRLAYWLIRNGRTELDRDRAERIVAEALPAVPAAARQGDAAAVLRHLLLRSGLLREPVAGSVQFVHRTFQDYLGAKAAVEDGDIGLLVAHAEDVQWEDVIRMAVAHARPRERAELLRELLVRGDATDDPATRLRVHLLALACLEHATELDPAVREEVNARARAILPPRSREESRLLASVGPLVVELLPGPEGLEDDEAQEVVATAALVGSDAAFEVIKRFRSHGSRRGQVQLAASWRAFDTEPYARDVLRYLDQDVMVTAESTAELRALKELGGRRGVVASGAFTARELLDELVHEPLRSLTIDSNPEIADLGFLREFPNLEWLSLWGCPAVESLAPLADLDIRTLNLLGPPEQDLPTPPGLDALTGLTTLGLYSRLPDGIPALPARAPLTFLALGAPLGAEFTGLTSWPSLRTLHLPRLTEAFGEDQWAELASLAELRWLSVGLASDEVWSLDLPPGVRLPQVTTLELVNPARVSAARLSVLLETLLPAFPCLTRLNVYGAIDAPIALPPLPGLSELRELGLYGLRPDPFPDLPPSVELTLHPRPRA